MLYTSFSLIFTKIEMADIGLQQWTQFPYLEYYLANEKWSQDGRPWRPILHVSFSQWTLKRLERYLVMSGLTTEWSRHGGSHMGQKHAWEKIVLNFYFSWTVNSNKYAVLTTLSSTLLRTKENCQNIRNLGEVFLNRLRVLSRRELRWPANWPTCQPLWWL